MATRTPQPVHCCRYLLPSQFPAPVKPTAQLKPSATAPPPPVFISTKPLHVNPHHLRDLYSLCNRSCHQFPKVDEPLDLLKLTTAIAHSSVVVSVFTNPDNLRNQSTVTNSTDIVGDWVRKVVRVTPENGHLVGFGRAVSDLSLTASIYDVMVHPALQGRGIGRRIVHKIIRMLTNKEIYDIAALCRDAERPFFSACGFGYDMLGSTTMMYTRAPSDYSQDEQTISAGRKLLLVPCPKTHLQLRSHA